MSPLIAWTSVLFLYILPIMHVVFSTKIGPWQLPAASECPFSPRAGWLVIILLTGIFGWFGFIRALKRIENRQTPIQRNN